GMTVANIVSTLEKLHLRVSAKHPKKETLINSFVGQFERITSTANVLNVMNNLPSSSTAQPAQPAQPPLGNIEDITTKPFTGTPHRIGGTQDDKSELIKKEAETLGINPDDLFKDDINIHVVFVDLRQNPPPHWDDFTVKFDATKSPSTLAVVILEEYDDYRGQLKEFLDLSDRNFRQCLFFADDALVGKKSMMSLKTLGISDGATVEMRLFEIDDPRFAKLWEDALEEEKKKMMRELVILIPQETETTRLTFCFDQQTSGEDMFFFIKEA
ncbi:unnamed protein product, partial [Effrenium voratum]